MPVQHLNMSVNVNADGLVPWSCGALEMQMMQWKACQRHLWVMVLSHVAWHECAGISRARTANNHVVTHAAIRRGAWILGVWH
jgi:hypothetical protein